VHLPCGLHPRGGRAVVRHRNRGQSPAESLLPCLQVETLKATTGGKPITYKIAYGLPVEVMLEWGLYISKPRCGCCPTVPHLCLRQHCMQDHVACSERRIDAARKRKTAQAELHPMGNSCKARAWRANLR